MNCPVCGKPVPARITARGRPRKFCSDKCARAYSRTPATYRKECPVCGVKFTCHRKDQKCCSHRCSRKLRYATPSDMAAFKRRARLAKRDLDFRDSPYAPPVTVEERGGRVIETRGRTCLGWRSCGHVSHNS